VRGVRLRQVATLNHLLRRLRPRYRVCSMSDLILMQLAVRTMNTSIDSLTSCMLYQPVLHYSLPHDRVSGRRLSRY